ncbi:tobH protein [Aldersonia sp. NBC_00410]|uniref:tobH protein n=1 Tax=Aldersonia sp. NBC_00410 TaxID=2975954 RepID=UPI0022522CD1|nr:tobH protein [Aldersonia sp. NBC_00410]MCX5044536.1 tobH protein [Aldersonia sp. NBC_00410]
MTAFSVLDLDDAASLQAADTDGRLRAAALGGAQVRSVAAAVREDALARLAGLQPRTLLFVTAPGRATRAAALVIAALGDGAGLPIVQVAATPRWVGPLDVVVVAGDDAGDPRLVDSVAQALRRGAEVVVAAPDEGPLRAAGAGRAIVLPPRMQVLDHHAMLRYLAVCIAVLAAVDRTASGRAVPDLDRLADLLDAEAIRDHPTNEVFHNPAKSLAARMQNRRVVLAGDGPASSEVARHGAEVLLREAGTAASAANLPDAVATAEFGHAKSHAGPGYDPFFHDEQIDGPALQSPLRVFVLSTEANRRAVELRFAALSDAELVTAEPEEAPEAAGDAPGGAGPGPGRVIEQLAVLAVRLEMAAAYLRLISGAGEWSIVPGAENEEESV